ncbi:MAG TPA: EAL domain-containing protein [Mycobacteriales bacterium]|nr:EAL domain-containing protein [Mycobacteriales bacterium]
MPGRETQQVLGALLDAVVVCDAMRDFDGRVTDFRIRHANPVAAAALGLTPETAVGWGLLELLSAVRDTAFPLLVHTCDTGEVFRREVEPGTAALPGTYEIVAVRLGDGLLITGRDTRRRHRATEELADSETRFRSVFQASPIGAFLATVDGCVQQLNGSLAAILGGTEEDLVGVPLDRIAPDSAGLTVTDVLAGAVRTPGVSAGYDGVFTRRDGSSVLCRVVLTAVGDADGAARYVVGHVQDVTDNRVALARLAYTADHDELTGLVNRTRLVTELSARLASGPVTALYIDLDDFKVVNDSLGHTVGDRLLRRVAERFGAVTGPDDVLARLGGDEFVVLAEAGEPARVAELAEALHTSVSAPIVLDGREFVVGASIGVAHGERGGRPGALLRDADTAMYEAKRTARSETVVFDETLRHRAIERLEGEADLRRALENGELLVHLQPAATAPRGRVVAVEALVRWQHPTRGLLLPGAFLPVAEASSLAYEVDRYVLHRALELLAGWENHPELARIRMAVNVSPTHLVRRPYLTELPAALEEYGVEPTRLYVEITENTLLQDSPEVVAALTRLRDLGVRSVVDDFGVGYSSLAYLRDLPVSGLKIDRRFVRGLGTPGNDGRLLGALCQLASAVGLDYIVEGVETAAEDEGVIALGVPLVQGFAYCAPVPPERLAEVVGKLAVGERRLA